MGRTAFVRLTAYLAFGLLLTAPIGVRAAFYSVTGLGTVAGANFCVGTALNDNGQVAGNCFFGGSTRAFSYSAGAISDLGVPAGIRNSYAYGINNHGQIGGTLEPVSGNFQGMFWDGTTMHSLGTALQQAIGMNDIGQIGGTGGVPGTASYPGGSVNVVAPLGTSAVYDLNNSGQATGIFPGGPNTHAFFFDGTTVHDVGTLGGAMSQALSINESGQIAGMAYTTGEVMHAMKWDGSMTDLGTLGGASSIAFGINDDGFVVGNSDVGGGIQHAFIWDSADGMRDLNALIDLGSGWILENAQAISSDGTIMGVGTRNGRTETFLLRPEQVMLVSEPGAAGLALLGLAAVFFAQRRR